MTNYILSQSNARKTFPHLKFIRDLSNGQQKAVFQVQDLDGKTFCLKVIPSTHESNRFKREIEIATRIQSKYVARIIEYGEIPRVGFKRSLVSCHFLLEEFM